MYAESVLCVCRYDEYDILCCQPRVLVDNCFRLLVEVDVNEQLLIRIYYPSERIPTHSYLQKAISCEIRVISVTE